MVITLVSPMPMVERLNALATATPESTTREALAATLLAPALLEVSAPMGIVFAYVLALALVTFTVTVHEPLAGIVPAESATLAPPLAAVTAPAQVVAPAGVAVLTRPTGYVSVNAAPVIAVVFGLLSVMVSTDAAPVPR